MSLEKKVKETKKLSDTLLALSYPYGFAIGCEKQPDQTVYTLLNNIGGHTTIPSGHNAHSLNTREPTTLSPQAKATLETYMATLEDPIATVTQEVKTIYKNLKAPLNIKPLHYRAWGTIATVAGLTATYPLAVPVTFALMIGENFIGNRGEASWYLFVNALRAPFLLPAAITELISPSLKGFRVTNKKILHTQPGNDPAVHFAYGKQDPSFFGDASGEFTEFIFPDGLILHNNSIYTQENYADTYNNAEYYMRVDPCVKQQLNSFAQQQDTVWEEWRTFRDGIDRAELTKLLEHKKFL